MALFVSLLALCASFAQAAPTSPNVANNPLEVRQSTWNPPSSMVKDLDDVWKRSMQASNALTFKNYGWDQIFANKGSLNYCVRWQSTATVTAAERASVEKAIQRSFKAWIDKLVGFDGWPYATVPVKVVGWAANSASQLQGDTSNIDVYTSKDVDGIPECDPKCGRFFHQNGDYSGCPKGASHHYDASLTLKDGMTGGAGGDWGQVVGREYFMQNLNTQDIHIFEHELGHYFALADFYDWKPAGQNSFIMLSGSATKVTEFDGWMLRDWWRHLKSRYSL